MAEWEFRREVQTASVVYERYWHDSAGAAVVYGGKGRNFDVYINGVYHEVPWPDAAARYNGDHGSVLGARIRWDPEWGWTLYAYMFNGDGNPHAEWDVQIGD